ncbi:hypothetical protein F2Q70_00020375 [Brassica cretica]|uniref:Uncharacterized protein n=1 Tax=Brassica cretica TaxID=69181 RepID=A0A8S9GV57_BRACR|nr:hypothetical protein F2Q70_00020375 [Brassica cretica]
MEAVIDLFWRVGENQEAVGGEGRRLEPRFLSRSDFPFCRSSMGTLMTARDIGETSPRYQIYLPCDVVKSVVGVFKDCENGFSRFYFVRWRFQWSLQIRFFFRMSGGVRLARLRFVESVFGLLSRSKWTLSASNQYPKVV